MQEKKVRTIHFLALPPQPNLLHRKRSKQKRLQNFAAL